MATTATGHPCFNHSLDPFIALRLIALLRARHVPSYLFRVLHCSGDGIRNGGDGQRRVPRHVLPVVILLLPASRAPHGLEGR